MLTYSKIHKLFFIIIVCFLHIPALTIAAQFVSVKKDGVNVHTGPGTNYSICMELPKGYPLKMIKKRGDWLEVSDFEDDKGWISASLVLPGTTVIVKVKQAVKMRSKPSTSASVIATVNPGVLLTKISRKEKWVKVRSSKGFIGWMYSGLLWPLRQDVANLKPHSQGDLLPGGPSAKNSWAIEKYAAKPHPSKPLEKACRIRCDVSPIISNEQNATS